jgi:hypothetical protein
MKPPHPALDEAALGEAPSDFSSDDAADDPADDPTDDPADDPAAIHADDPAFAPSDAPAASGAAGTPDAPEQAIVLPPRRASARGRSLETVGILLGTSAPQPLDGSLTVSVIKTDVRSRTLSALAAVLNRGKTASPKTDLRFSVDGGGTQRVIVPELSPGETRNVKIKLRMPNRDRPQAMSVTFLDRRYSSGSRATQ